MMNEARVGFAPEANPLSAGESHHKQGRQGGDVNNRLKRENIAESFERNDKILKVLRNADKICT